MNQALETAEGNPKWQTSTSTGWDLLSLLQHESRTALTTVLGFLEMVLDGEAGTLTDSQIRFLHSARSGAEELNNILAKVGEVARIEAGRIELSPQRVNIAQQIDQAIGRLDQSSGSGGQHAVILRHDASSLEVRADPNRLTEIIATVLSRARHYATDRGPVEVTLKSDGSMVSVEVTGGVRSHAENGALTNQSRNRINHLEGTPIRDLHLELARALIDRQDGKAAFTEGPEGVRLQFSLPAEAVPACEG